MSSKSTLTSGHQLTPSLSLPKSLSTTNLAQTIVKEAEQEQSENDAILRQVYDHYVSQFGRAPLIAGHLRDFGNNFADVQITWAEATTFLDRMRVTSTAPRQKPKRGKIGLMQSENSSRSLDKKVSVATVDDEKDDGNMVEDDDLSDIEVIFATKTTLEILHLLRTRIIHAVRSEDVDTETALHMIWEREYAELESRIRRVDKQRKLGMSRRRSTHQYHTQSNVQRDSTYKALKEIAGSTKVDEESHTSAMFFLENYYPNTEDAAIRADMSPRSRSRARISGSSSGASAREEKLFMYDTMVKKAREKMYAQLKLPGLPNPEDEIKKQKSAPVRRGRGGPLTISGYGKPKLETIESSQPVEPEIEEEQPSLGHINTPLGITTPVGGSGTDTPISTLSGPADTPTSVSMTHSLAVPGRDSYGLISRSTSIRSKMQAITLDGFNDEEFISPALEMLQTTPLYDPDFLQLTTSRAGSVTQFFDGRDSLTVGGMSGFGAISPPPSRQTSTGNTANTSTTPNMTNIVSPISAKVAAGVGGAFGADIAMSLSDEPIDSAVNLDTKQSKVSDTDSKDSKSDKDATDSKDGQNSQKSGYIVVTTPPPQQDKRVSFSEEGGFVYNLSAASDTDTETSPVQSPKDAPDRVPRNLLNVMAKYAEKMDSWDFDLFEFMDDPALHGKQVVLAGFFLFRKTGLLDATGVSQENLWRFLEEVQNGYLDNPYHNMYHGVDVMLNTHYMFQSSLFKKHMTIWDAFGSYIAAVCHDLGHMGLNNNWYIHTAGNLALLYGDESVLENHHVAETFRILNKAECNWMSIFPSSIRHYLAFVIRRCIIGTDMKYHGAKVLHLAELVDAYKGVVKEHIGDVELTKEAQHELIAEHVTFWRSESLSNYASLDGIKRDEFSLFLDESLEKKGVRDVIIKDMDIDNKEEMRVPDIDDERIFLLEITVHTCDVGNPGKRKEISVKWGKRYLEEAFQQGDKERDIGIPVSAGMDRNTSKLPISQLGFIQYVVKRLYQLYAELIDVADVVVENMMENEKFWTQEKVNMSMKKLPTTKRMSASMKRPSQSAMTSNLKVISESPGTPGQEEPSIPE